jgi:hypothetical protein
MSHCIIAYKKFTETKHDDGISFNGEEISELSYSMGNRNSYIPYALLDSLECHGGVSGIGEKKEYKLDDIKKALENIQKVKNFFISIENEIKENNLEKITIWWG